MAASNLSMRTLQPRGHHVSAENAAATTTTTTTTTANLHDPSRLGLATAGPAATGPATAVAAATTPSILTSNTPVSTLPGPTSGILHNVPSPSASASTAAAAAAAAAASSSVGMKRKATTACRNCQKKRTRCSAGWPCTNCVRAHVECHYAPLADRRRKDFAQSVSAEEMMAMSQRLAEQDTDLNYFRRAWACLEGSDERRANCLWALIRQKASPVDVRDFLDRAASPSSPRARQLSSGASVPSAKVRVNLPPSANPPPPSTRGPASFSLRALCDEPLFDVPAYPWTTVTSDDAFVSHLISLWFAWCEPYMSWIHRDLFIRDMRSSNLNSPFCSRFLVNAICAQACAWSDYPEAKPTSGDRSTPGLHFYEQARNEYERLDGKASVTAVQGLIVFALSTILCGKERRGWHWMQTAVAQAKELRAMPDRVHPFTTPEHVDDLSLVRSRTEWGLYKLVTCSSLSLQVEAIMHKPQVPRPPVAHSCEKSKRWIPYPQRAPETFFHEGCYFEHHCELAVTSERINRLLFPGDSDVHHPSPTKLKLAEACMDELRAWRKNLPPCLELQKHSLPGLLTLYMLYEGLVIVVATALRGHNDFNNDQKGPSASNRSHASTLCLESALEMSRLFERFKTAWDLDRMPSCFNHWATVALLTLLEGLDDPRYRDAFAIIFAFLRQGRRRWPIAHNMLRVVRLRALGMGVVRQLPDETNTFFAETEAQEAMAAAEDELNHLTPSERADNSLYADMVARIKHAQAAEARDGRA